MMIRRTQNTYSDYNPFDFRPENIRAIDGNGLSLSLVIR